MYNKAPIDLIPHGIYCYTVDNKGNRKVCPFWSKEPNYPEQMNGYCDFLKKGDWMDNGTSLLWDQCKECGVNVDET